MISRYVSGRPVPTGAAVRGLPAETMENFPFAHRSEGGRFTFSFPLEKDGIVYGLGEAPRGINKRGWIYRSFCSDEYLHTEDREALYAAHNFLLYGGCGIFIDFPAEIRWDIGYTRADEAVITLDGEDFEIYLIFGETPRGIVREFRALIGKSYVPPLWAFGFQQSRWSYPDAETVRSIVRGYDEAGIPLDAVYLDIDYMDHYKNFTVDRKAVPDLAGLAAEMKQQGIHLVPIIDAGVKKEEGYGVYEEGRDRGYFCKNADGSDFEGAVWPGIVGFPDFLRPEVREWFGEKYRVLTDMGIDGFWNDMNEPAIFYSAKGLADAFEKVSEMRDGNLDLSRFFALKGAFEGLDNRREDYASIFHEIGGQLVRIRPPRCSRFRTGPRPAASTEPARRWPFPPGTSAPGREFRPRLFSRRFHAWLSPIGLCSSARLLFPDLTGLYRGCRNVSREAARRLPANRLKRTGKSSNI